MRVGRGRLPQAARILRAAVAGGVIGAGLLMTGCSGGTPATSSASPTADPAAVMACGLLADADNAVLTAIHRHAEDPSSDMAAATRRAIITLGTQTAAARDAAPDSLLGVFNEAYDAVSDQAHQVEILDGPEAATSNSSELNAAEMGAIVKVGAALRACVHAGVPVQTVDYKTGLTHQMAG